MASEATAVDAVPQAENQPAAKESGKKRKKPTSAADKVVKPPRSITVRNLRKFDEADLRRGIEYLVKKKCLPAKLSNSTKGNALTKMKKEALLDMCPAWASANIYKAVMEQKKEHARNAPKIQPKQAEMMKRLDAHSAKNISLCVRALDLSIQNMYNMKKDELVQAVALHEQGKKVLKAVEELKSKQEQEAKEKMEKSKAAEHDSSSEEEEDSDDQPQEEEESGEEEEESESSSSESDAPSKKKSKKH